MIKKILERLEAELEEERIGGDCNEYSSGILCGYRRTIKTVQEVANKYGEKQSYKIHLEGCDDDTIFEMELTKQDYLLLARVSELANKTSIYGCMPRMYVTEKEHSCYDCKWECLDGCSLRRDSNGNRKPVYDGLTDCEDFEQKEEK